MPTLRLTCVRETQLARLYKFKDGENIWIPKSVCKSVVKFPLKDPLDLQVHEINIEDWWWEKWEKGQDENDD